MIHSRSFNKGVNTMNELERTCLKQNATKLRRIAKVMNALQDADKFSNGYHCRDKTLEDYIDDLKGRLEDIVLNMKNLQEVLKIPLKKKEI